jgi:hypothetical protein
MNLATTTQAGYPFLDAEQAHSLVFLEIETSAVVLDRQRQASGFLLHANSNRLGLRMTRAIVQGLLHDTIDASLIGVGIVIRKAFGGDADIHGGPFGHFARLPAERRHQT